MTKNTKQMHNDWENSSKSIKHWSTLQGWLVA